MIKYTATEWLALNGLIADVLDPKSQIFRRKLLPYRFFGAEINALQEIAVIYANKEIEGENICIAAYILKSNPIDYSKTAISALRHECRNPLFKSPILTTGISDNSALLQFNLSNNDKDWRISTTCIIEKLEYLVFG